MNMMNTMQILSMSPLDLVAWLDENFLKPLPMPETSAEFAKNKALLAELANTYAYLVSLHSVAQIMVRDAKDQGLPKAHINNAIDRRDIIAHIMEAVKMQYNAFSRMITVQQQADAEARMMNKT
jgi:hypothetical protein